MADVEVTVEHVEEDVMRTRTPSGHEVLMDSKAEPGGQGATPVELLAASAGACSLIDVAMILRKKRLAFEDLNVRVEADRREDHPRAFTKVRLVYEVTGAVPEEAFASACRLSVEKYCTVLATIEETAPVAWDARVLDG